MTTSLTPINISYQNTSCALLIRKHGKICRDRIKSAHAGSTSCDPAQHKPFKFHIANISPVCQLTPVLFHCESCDTIKLMILT